MSSSLLSHTSDMSSSNQSLVPHNVLLRSPNSSEYSSHSGHSRNKYLIEYAVKQPESNPHAHFLTRSVENCPLDLSEQQRNKWFKAGDKARLNQELLSNTDRFHWPTSYYTPPIHIHHKTPISTIQTLIDTLVNVRLYTIDTECDKPTKRYPHSRPALLQIQAIHHEFHSTVVLLEIQYLPAASSYEFGLIQKLCSLIFSDQNQIICWGEVVTELEPYEKFNLFSTSHITNYLNLQKDFTQKWNKQHPHLPECSQRYLSTPDEYETDDVLVCLVNSDDLDTDLNSNDVEDDYSTCICPENVRPYKAKNAVWSLQRAIKSIFDQAIDKSMTLNNWSCGLDICLKTSQTEQDKQTRHNLISYAIVDLFAPTCLYFHMNKPCISTAQSMHSPGIHAVMSSPSPNLPMIFILADSHGRNLSPVINTSSSTIHTRAISGLQWNNKYNSALCARSIILSAPIASILKSSTKVLFIIGTNSIRQFTALELMDQIDDFIHLLRTQHSHLHDSYTISILATFPCYKTSHRFSSESSLNKNIQSYNELLSALSSRLNFSFIDFHINEQQLKSDRMHLHSTYQEFFQQSIIHYFDELGQERPIKTKVSSRSREAIHRRNKKRHDKMKIKIQKYTISRPIHPKWSLKILKQYLQHQDIHYQRLPEIYNHQLRIQFSNTFHKQHAEQALSLDAFDEIHCDQWLHTKSL